jgi:hypothetical protein
VALLILAVAVEEQAGWVLMLGLILPAAMDKRHQLVALL